MIKTNYSIVIIAENEESNIGCCIGSCIRFSDDVWVIDSYSTDGTRDIASRLGAKVVEHKFESWGEQRNYVLENLKLKYDFVLFLDADEMIDGTFANELYDGIKNEENVAFNVNFDIVFMGRVLKYAHEYLPVLRVIKKQAGRWLSEGAREYCAVTGPVGKIKARIRHEDRKGIFFWLTKHIRNANREANVLMKGKWDINTKGIKENRRIERPNRVLLRRLYGRLPRGVRPLLVFIYRYFIKLGFLDGYPGFVFCFLQAYWYNFIVDVRLFEIPLGYDSYLPVYGGEKTVSTDVVDCVDKKNQYAVSALMAKNGEKH